MSLAGRRRRTSGSAWYFDRVAAGYLGRYSAGTPGGQAFRERKERVLELLGTDCGRVLDVGCGPGIMAADLVAQGCTFVGMDASGRMVEEGRRRFPGRGDITFAVAEAGALPCRDHAFDIVLCTGVIDRMPEPAAAVLEMARVLRPGGTLLISFPNRLSPYVVWRGWVFLPALAVVKGALHAVTGRSGGPAMLSRSQLWTRRGAEQLVKTIVGPVEDVVVLNFNLLLPPVDELFPRVAMRVAERAQKLGTTRLRWLGAAFLVRAAREPGRLPER